MSETVNGADLSGVILQRGTTAAEVAEMELEVLTRTVAYRREKWVPAGAVDPTLTDDEIARAILEYAQSEPEDWPVPSIEKDQTIWWAVVLAGAIGAVMGTIPGILVFRMAAGSGTSGPPSGLGMLLAIIVMCLGLPAGAGLGVLFGAVGQLIGRRTCGKLGAIVGSVVGVLVGGSFLFAMGYLLLT
jgi:hypothetical protein